MDRISEALERARANREAATQLLKPRNERQDLEERDEPGSPSSEVSISYTEARRITLDPQRLQQNRIVIADSDVAAPAYKVLRTRLVQRMRANGWKTLCVTSPGQGNGKSLTAINLAISIARDANQSILLIDADLVHPTIMNYLTDEPVLGLSEYLSGGAELSDILVHLGMERLLILPGERSGSQSSELLSSPRMVSLLDEVTSRYRDLLIILDLPPVLVGDDVIAVLPLLDAVLLVVEEGKTTRDEIKRAKELLGQEKIAGVVLNRSREANPTIGYY
jgi:capsular exopolysaccharide synthesis family protein